MVRYFGLYSRRNKDKDQFIKMIDKKIVKIKKSIEKWKYRLLASFGVDPCKCPKCRITENIPREIVEYLDEMDQSNIDEPTCFA